MLEDQSMHDQHHYMLPYALQVVLPDNTTALALPSSQGSKPFQTTQSNKLCIK